jgi:hypothetical protein
MVAQATRQQVLRMQAREKLMKSGHAHAPARKPMQQKSKAEASGGALAAAGLNPEALSLINDLKDELVRARVAIEVVNEVSDGARAAPSKWGARGRRARAGECE